MTESEQKIRPIQFHRANHLQCQCKSDKTNTLNFTRPMTASIYTVRHTKRAKSDATICKSQIVEMSLDCNFIPGHALPLNFVRFFRLAHNLPMIQRRPASRSRDSLIMSGKITGATTHETTNRLMRISRLVTTPHLARQLAGCSCTDRAAGTQRSKPQLASILPGFSPVAVNHCIQRL